MVSPPTTFEPPNEPSVEPTAAATPRPRRSAPVKAVVGRDQIDEAWTAFPQMSRRNSGRKKFDPAFVAAASLGGAEAVLRAIVAYADDLKARGKESCFSKAAHTWLNDGRWRSWPEAEPEVAAGPEYHPWPMRRRRWEDDRYWDRDWGPRPDRPGCLAPWTMFSEAA